MNTQPEHTSRNSTAGRSQPARTIDELTRRLNNARRFTIGFPAATDFDYTELSEILTKHLLNNIGDPYIPGTWRGHTKSEERQVVDWCADLFRAPADDRWGYVSSCGSESNFYALHQAKSLLPGAFCYFSDSAHYSIEKHHRSLSLPAVRIRSDAHGEIDYADLRTQISLRRDRPAIVVATIGTTMAEAIDDVRRITDILDDLAVRQRYIHADAALAGIPLGLLNPDDRPGFDFTDGADSIAVSGHKFIGSPIPSSVVITKASSRTRAAQSVGYIDSPDTTVGGSRSGHAPLILWHAITKHGITGMRQRAEHARALATHLHKGLQQLGWDTYRHPHAFTTVLRTPPEPVLHKWILASDNGWSHVITMPGVTNESINAFLHDITNATRSLKANILLQGAR
ncbi:histidine decarboxylase [Paractinoplanes ferrugineus]|uniref:Histidine decarboxylase n=1 Tax=Paractinoplanes ferrugineus TaxID=113564 RepID=A0A919J522_9ACTN|nr:histidine decarboxylase [Actinoplanes ferrugineus]GIE14123.1 histidine decarboxylase [Actinoplanes ferrugineus]